MDGLTIAPAAEIAPALLHQAFTAAFSDYLLGPFRLAPEQWPQFVGRQGVDLGPSRVALVKGELAAFALVAPRADIGHWRLATMGALPAARGSGAAPALLDDFIARAGAAGMAGVELECFEQNERALRLYRGRGFVPLHPLYGYSREGEACLPAPAGIDAIELDAAFGWIDALSRERRDLPLQVTPLSLRALPVPLQAWRRGTAQLVFSAAGSDALTVHSLLDARPAQDDAQALAGALLQRHPGLRVNVPQLQRPDLGGDALQRLGFERLPLNQLLMRRRA
jgi:ribosomal protein S18 acetylase RimI-like enzyme